MTYYLKTNQPPSKIATHSATTIVSDLTEPDTSDHEDLVSICNEHSTESLTVLSSSLTVDQQYPSNNYIIKKAGRPKGSTKAKQIGFRVLVAKA
jgi:hypothetical protein